MRNLPGWFLELIWPRGLKCVCCDNYSYGEVLCPECEDSLASLRLDGKDNETDLVRSAYVYDGTARLLVLLLKEECIEAAAMPLAKGMSEVLKQMKLPADIVLTWVTMPALRQKKRSFDHGQTLCRAVAELTGSPCLELLERVGEPHTQRGLNKEKRMRNLAGTIRCSQKLNTPVLLIDDVTTTGATAALCAHVLMEAGATGVYVLTAAKAAKRKKHDDLYHVNRMITERLI